MNVGPFIQILSHSPFSKGANINTIQALECIGISKSYPSPHHSFPPPMFSHFSLIFILIPYFSPHFSPPLLFLTLILFYFYFFVLHVNPSFNHGHGFMGFAFRWLLFIGIFNSLIIERIDGIKEQWRFFVIHKRANYKE